MLGGGASVSFDPRPGCARRAPPTLLPSVAPRAALAVSPPNPFDSRRLLMGAAKRLLDPDEEAAPDPRDVPPRLTPHALQSLRMSRSRDKILANLEEMYREAFERARTSGDQAQMATLDFAYRREQLYFEILLDVRDAMERRP